MSNNNFTVNTSNIKLLNYLHFINLNYSNNNKYNINTPLTYGNFKIKLFIKKTFQVYTNIILFSKNYNNKPHNSFMSFFVNNTKQNSNSILSIKKFYSKYLNSFYFIYNIFFYKINFLTFGNSFFKNELFSINWILLKNHTFRHNQTDLSVFINPIKRNKSSIKLTSLINSTLNIKSILITDYIFHKTTVYFFQKQNTLTVGLLPITSNYTSLDVVIPVPSDNIFSQSFFIKLLVSFKKAVESNLYTLFKKT